MLVAASDYVKALPDSIDRWLPRPLTALGTDGFGRSESRAGLREFFEVDYRYVDRRHAGGAGARRARSTRRSSQQAIKTHNINPEKAIRRFVVTARAPDAGGLDDRCDPYLVRDEGLRD